MSALTRCLEEEAAAIAAAAERLSSTQVEAALELLEGCRQRRAKLVVTGVGTVGGVGAASPLGGTGTGGSALPPLADDAATPASAVAS